LLHQRSYQKEVASRKNLQERRKHGDLKVKHIIGGVFLWN